MRKKKKIIFSVFALCLILANSTIITSSFENNNTFNLGNILKLTTAAGESSVNGYYQVVYDNIDYTCMNDEGCMVICGTSYWQCWTPYSEDCKSGTYHYTYTDC